MNPMTNFCTFDYFLTLVMLAGLFVGWEANRHHFIKLGHGLILLSLLCPLLLHLVVYDADTALIKGSTFARIMSIMSGYPGDYTTPVNQIKLVFLALLYIATICLVIYIIFRMQNQHRALKSTANAEKNSHIRTSSTSKTSKTSKPNKTTKASSH